MQELLTIAWEPRPREGRHYWQGKRGRRGHRVWGLQSVDHGRKKSGLDSEDLSFGPIGAF